MPPVQKQLGQILLEMGVVDERKVNEALDHQRRMGGQKIGQAMVELGFIDEVQLAKALCRQFRLPFVDLARARISPQVADLVPRQVIADFPVVPVKIHQGKLVLATDDPMVTFAADDLRFVLNRELTFAVTPSSGLANARSEAYGIGEPVKDAARRRAAVTEEVEDAEAPVIRLVHQILEQALSQRASDIHVEPMGDRVRVRYRVDGVCYEAHSLDAELTGPVVTRLKVMARMDIAEHRKPQDGRINVQLLGRPIDIRASLLPATNGESMVMRLLDREAGLVDLEDLGFVGEDLDRFERIIRRPNGIFLVTGPTGSGKTTTLYAALKRLNKPNVKIITAENPVEYNLEGINQAEVRHNIGLDFARILRSMLRQAPNIILVGEIRDQETAEIAIQAALTGHLVFSTLHTNDAPSALTRLNRHGGEALPGVDRRHGRPRPAARAAALPDLPAAGHARRVPPGRGGALTGRRRGAADLPGGRLPGVPIRGLQGPGRALRAVRDGSADPRHHLPRREHPGDPGPGAPHRRPAEPPSGRHPEDPGRGHDHRGGAPRDRCREGRGRGIGVNGHPDRR